VLIAHITHSVKPPFMLGCCTKDLYMTNNWNCDVYQCSGGRCIKTSASTPVRNTFKIDCRLGTDEPLVRPPSNNGYLQNTLSRRQLQAFIPASWLQIARRS
jgi:hypothetical protein